MTEKINYEKMIEDLLILFMVGLTTTLVIASCFDFSFPIRQIETAFHSFRDGLRAGAVYAAKSLPNFAVFGAMILMGSGVKEGTLKTIEKLTPMAKAITSLIKKEMDKEEKQDE